MSSHGVVFVVGAADWHNCQGYETKASRGRFKDHRSKVGRIYVSKSIVAFVFLTAWNITFTAAKKTFSFFHEH